MPAAANEPACDPLHRFFGALGRFSVRFRWAIVAAWLIAAVVVSVAFPTLASVTKANNTSFLPGNVPSEQAADLASPLQKANLVPVSVVAVTSGGRQLDAADALAIASVARALRRVATVNSVRDLGRSPDGQAEQLLVLSDIPVGGSQASITLVDDLESAAHAVPAPSGLSVHLAGELASQVASQGKNSGNAVQLLSGVFILILLLLIFRAALAPFVTLLPAFLVVVVAGPVIAELSKVGLQVSTLSQLLLIVLVLGAGTDYGLFLVFRVREEIRGGRDPKDAVAYSLSRVGESISFSAGTVIAALLSLLLATFGLYQSLGAPLAIGIGFMLLAGLTLQPALLAIFGRAVFWPSRPRAGDVRTGLWGRVAARIVATPALTLIVGLVVFGALAVASTGNKPAGFGNALSAPSGTDAAAGDAALSKHFPAAAVNPTNLVFRTATPVWSDPAVLATAARELTASSLFTKVSGPLNPLGGRLTPAALEQLHARLGPASALPAVPPATSTVPLGVYEAYRATSSYLSADGRTFQFETSLSAGDPSTTAALEAVPAIRAETTKVAQSIGAGKWGVAGEAPGIYDVSSVSNHDLVRVIPVAILVIALLLGLVMRSLVAPLYLIASVVLSYFAALGLAVVLFVYLGGSGGLTFILPFLMFIFLLALGEDYNILVMTRIREEARIYPLRTAVARAITATGSTVTSAGLVLAGTFAVFALVGGRSGGGSQIEDVGAGLALGVIMDTFLVRTLLVPSTVALLGHWNWWPSKITPRGPSPDPAAGQESAPVVEPA